MSVVMDRNYKKQAKTSAERTREYRARKKHTQSILESFTNTNNVLNLISHGQNNVNNYQNGNKTIKPLRQYPGRRKVVGGHCAQTHTRVLVGNAMQIFPNDLPTLKESAMVEINIKRNKSNAERCREYRARKRLAKQISKSNLNEQSAVFNSSVKIAKSNLTNQSDSDNKQSGSANEQSDSDNEQNDSSNEHSLHGQSDNDKRPNLTSLGVKKGVAKSAAQRMREYRARQRTMRESVSGPSTDLTLFEMEQQPYPGYNRNKIKKRLYGISRKKQGTSVLKQESAIDDSNVDATLSRGVKQEFIEIELTPVVDAQKCAQATPTPTSAVHVEQDVCVKQEVEDPDLDIGPTVLQPMFPCHRTNQENATIVKTENTITYDVHDPIPCSSVKEEIVEDECGGVDAQQCNQTTSSPVGVHVAVSGVDQGIFIKLQGTKLVIVPTMLHHNNNEGNTSVVKTENTIDYDGNDPISCSAVKEESADETCVDAESNIYICDYCQKTFTDKMYIKRHIICVHASGSYRCNQCESSFKCEAYLKVHKAKMHTTLMKECNICGESMRLKILKTHMLRKHNDNKLLCKICGEVMKSKYYLHHHMNDVHGQQSIDSRFFTRCDYCQKIFSKKNLSTHIKYVHADIVHKCSECVMGFTSEHFLHRHIKLMHFKKGLEEHNQQSTCNNFVEESGESTHSPVGDVNAVASTSAQHQDVVVIKEEPVDEELELGPVVLQHMDSNYRPYKEEPLLD